MSKVLYHLGFVVDDLIARYVKRYLPYVPGENTGDVFVDNRHACVHATRRVFQSIASFRSSFSCGVRSAPSPKSNRTV